MDLMRKLTKTADALIVKLLTQRYVLDLGFLCSG